MRSKKEVKQLPAPVIEKTKDQPVSPQKVPEQKLRRPDDVFSKSWGEYYTEAKKLEYHRVYAGPDLDSIAYEIKVRYKITQREVFRIGELLIIAQNLCRTGRTAVRRPLHPGPPNAADQRKGLGFQRWVEDSCDFSYETALNFMRVFKCCLGFEMFAEEIPLSILYRVCAPSFPEELRQYLFVQGGLKAFDWDELNEIVEKYRNGEWPAVKEDVDRCYRFQLARRQINSVLGLCEKACATLRVFINRTGLQVTARTYKGKSDELEIKSQWTCESDEPLAKKINQRLYTALVDAAKQIDAALKASRRDLVKDRPRRQGDPEEEHVPAKSDEAA